jgi:hypothetical protein
LPIFSGFYRWNAVEHLTEGAAVRETLVGSVEQWTKDEQPRAKLLAAVQIGPEL